MRKIFSLLLSFAMMVALLASCAVIPPEDTTTTEITTVSTAEDLFEKIDEAMDALDSYQAEGTLTMTVFANGVEITTTSKQRQIEAGVHTGNYYFFRDADTKMSSDAMEIEQNMYSMEAYYNGSAYIWNTGAGLQQRIYSLMTKDEFFAYHEEDALSLSKENFNNCVNKEFVQNEDGSWRLDYSGYTKKTMNLFLSEMALDDGLFDNDILDMEFTILVDADFHVTQMTMRMVFDVEDGNAMVPTIEMTMAYSAYNKVTPNIEDLHLGEYTQVYDIRMLDILEEKIKDLQNKKDGSMALFVSQGLSLMGNYSSYTERDTISYGEKDGSYYYNITATAMDQFFKIDYANGIQTIQQNGVTETAEQSKTEAKAYIDGLINSAKYNKQYVTNISRVENGEYTEYQVTLSPEDSTYRAMVEGMGLTYISTNQTIIFTLINDEIEQIFSQIIVSCSYDVSGNTYNGTLKIETNANF